MSEKGEVNHQDINFKFNSTNQIKSPETEYIYDKPSLEVNHRDACEQEVVKLPSESKLNGAADRDRPRDNSPLFSHIPIDSNRNPLESYQLLKDQESHRKLDNVIAGIDHHKKNLDLIMKNSYLSSQQHASAFGHDSVKVLSVNEEDCETVEHTQRREVSEDGQRYCQVKAGFDNSVLSSEKRPMQILPVQPMHEESTVSIQHSLDNLHPEKLTEE